MASFRKVKFTMVRGSGYGQYEILSKYKGTSVKAHTTDSEAYDWFDDESNKEKHMAAKRHCYAKIVQSYENLKS